MDFLNCSKHAVETWFPRYGISLIPFLFLFLLRSHHLFFVKFCASIGYSKIYCNRRHGWQLGLKKSYNKLNELVSIYIEVSVRCPTSKFVFLLCWADVLSFLENKAWPWCCGNCVLVGPAWNFVVSLFLLEWQKAVFWLTSPYLTFLDLSVELGFLDDTLVCINLRLEIQTSGQCSFVG